ncbi:hypothetical protein ACS0Y7_19630 [Burkholderia gladioli]|uniref:hypothetical protein n=1 Tax=Burkholderia gladioli TaxID=28095 RepID=UPI003F78F911
MSVINFSSGYQFQDKGDDQGDEFPSILVPLVDFSDHSGIPLGGVPYYYAVGNVCTVDISDDVLKKIREGGEKDEVQHHRDVPLTKRVDPPSEQKKTTAPISEVAKKKNKNNSSDHQALIDRLNKKPHVIEFKGVVLDRNERLKIIAAVAICESGGDPFAAENLDSEFHMKISPNVSYAHIVHIGLSYGIIQFTQDGGALGKLLKKMQGKDGAKFLEVFGDNCDELVELTNSGIDVEGVDYLSGQAHWNSIRKKPAGKELSELARMNKLPQSREIRGKRVQPIAVNINGKKEDLWTGTWKQRFVEAGKVAEFQEAQLELAVEEYMNPALDFCKENNIRSALGIAYVVACVIRGAPKNFITLAAAEIGASVPFSDNVDEKSSVEHIAGLDAKKINKLGGKLVQRDEIIRAKKLLKDETGFLAEDLYWVGTYGKEYDK